MIMVADVLPGCKGFLKPVPLSETARLLVIRMIAGFLLHAGRMSCLQAGGAVRCEARHRAQISRFLARPRWRGMDINSLLRQSLLACESADGPWIYIIDATLCGQAGKKTENTYSTGNRQRRRQKGLTHRTTAEAAADLIRELPLPEGAPVVVLGDTAYDAEVVRDACADRNYRWIFPSNSERVLAGPKGKRPKVRSLLKDWSKWSRQTIRLVPAQGKYAVYRRLSAHRIGPKAKMRTYYVHQEKRAVHSVGEVRLVFSTTKANLKTATPDDVKILLTNALHLSLREVVELYSLRWQIELFFKELKSTLGFHQYKFRRFEAVEGWMALALTTFLYLEWHRCRQLARRGLSEEEKRWWRRQRTHGLCQAVRLASQQSELHYLAKRLETPRGIAKLKRLLRNSFAPEYRAAL